MSELARQRTFWILPPHAIQFSVRDEKEATLIIGKKNSWLEGFLIPTLKIISGARFEMEVEGVKEYGVHENMFIYGTTFDGGFFITRGTEIPPLKFTDKSQWLAALQLMGGIEEPKLQTPQEGFAAYKKPKKVWE